MATINQTVLSAEQAAKDSLERHLEQMCEMVETTDLFELQMQQKTLDVFVNYTPYSFTPFTQQNRPSEAGCIMELIKRKSFAEHQYQIIVRPNATSEMIQAALGRLVLPF